MRVVVVGATGNIGTSLVAALSRDPAVTEIVGVARRTHDWSYPKVRSAVADIAADDLAPLMAGADAVCHLAWAIQPSRDLAAVHRINVVGSRRVFDAAVSAGVPFLLHTSSIGAYSAGPSDGDRRVDESYPTDGIDSSFYSRQKSYVERVLDLVERAHPELRVVRVRPALVGKRAAAGHLRQLFIGPFLPNPVVGRLPLAPSVRGLRLQFQHADDVAEAMRLALHADVRGAFNLAADPVLEPEMLSDALGALGFQLPPAVARAAATATWRLRLQPSPPGWLDMALHLPLLDAGRAHRELGWRPGHDARSALDEVIAGLRDGVQGPTPPLSVKSRLQELATGVGARSGVRRDAPP